MKIYKNFCKTKSDIISDINSQLVWQGSDIQNVFFQSGQLNIQTVTGIHTYTLSNCSEFGDVTYAFADVTTVAWSVAFVLIAAFCVKVMKRGL